MTRTGPTAVIAEDEPLLAQALARDLGRAWPELEILRVVHDGEAAVGAILALRPAVAFLDIRMPGCTGLEVAARASAAGAAPAIVFVTAYDHHALSAFDAAAVDYLLKPVGAERLARCVDRLRARLAAPAPGDPAQAIRELLSRLAPAAGTPGPGPAMDAGSPGRLLRHIRASLGDLVRQIPVTQVLYFEARDKYVGVVTRDGTALVRLPLSELEASLDPAQFTRIHRSRIVNLDAIESIRRDLAGRTVVQLREPVQGREVRLAVGRQYAARFRGM